MDGERGRGEEAEEGEEVLIEDGADALALGLGLLFPFWYGVFGGLLGWMG